MLPPDPPSPALDLQLSGSAVPSTERALFGAPPSSRRNCYVKIPRTCFCKELKEGEEEIVFVGVSLSL